MTILITIVFGLMRGIQEGMIMTPGGVRESVIFDTYHLSGVLVIVLAAILLLRIVQQFPGWVYIIGLLVLLWECTELGYSFARWYVPFHPYEHVVFFDVIDKIYTGISVYAIHLLRISLSIILLIIGTVMNRLETHLQGEPEHGSWWI